MSKADQLKRAVSLGGGPMVYPPGTDPAKVAGKPARSEGVRGDRSAARIAVDRIERDPAQPREEFEPEALDRLAESLRTKGQLQPIRVRWDEGRGVYVVIAGERRWRAARMAGLAELQCVIHDGPMTPTELLSVQLVENALREDLRPVEQAKAYRSLMDSNGWTMTDLAGELAIHQGSVSRSLALLDLPCAAHEQIDGGHLSAAAAYEITKLEGPEIQAEIAQAAASEGLSRSEVAELVRAVKERRPAKARPPEPVKIDVEGATVLVKWKRGGDGLTAVSALKRALKQLQAQDSTQAA